MSTNGCCPMCSTFDNLENVKCNHGCVDGDGPSVEIAAKIERHAYYMHIARKAAARGTCPRRQVGAVLVADDRIISTGFNGAPRGVVECRVAGCLMEHGHCVRTVHAEESALLEVGGKALRGRIMRTPMGPMPVSPDVVLYTTTAPCYHCAKLIIQAGVPAVVFGEEYTDPTHLCDKATPALELLSSSGISVTFLKG